MAISVYSKSLFWGVFEKILRVISVIIVSSIVARTLGPSDFGVVNYSVSILFMFISVADFGTSAIVTKRIAENSMNMDVLLSSVFLFRILWGAGLAICFFIFALSSSASPMNRYVLLCFSPILLVEAFHTIDSFFVATAKGRTLAIVNVVALAFSSAFRIYIVLTHGSIISVALSYVVEYALVALLLSSLYKLDIITLRLFSLPILTLILKEATPIFVSGIAISLYMRVNYILINEYLSSSDVGYYSVAARISEAWYFVPVLISNSLMPQIVKLKIGSDNYVKRMEKVFTVIIWSCIGMALFIFIFAKIIVFNLYGDRYGSAVNVLRVHVFAGIFVGMGTASSMWGVIHGLQRYTLFKTITAAILNLMINVLFLRQYGVVVSAIGLLVAQMYSGFFSNLVFPKTRPCFFLLCKSFRLKF